ncbi:MAG TPA: cation diffusion facilitator family transporter [Ignavibacteriaceae bacterium]|nr:cation diffusion facilitator family transporter [Ignavibacteriaceae bacterium]
MVKTLRRATYLSLIVNIFLFCIKIIVGIISNSIAVISEAVNSLTDIVSSLAIMYSVRVSLKKPDEEHQFGHNAAQPIAVFLIALFTGIVGLNVVEESIGRIISPKKIYVSSAVYIVLGITIVVKIILTRYQSSVGKKFKSPALRASAVDSLNDVLASSLSILAIFLVEMGLPYVDGIGGILIAFFIFKTGYEIAKENLNYLMGRSADEVLILEIAKKAMSIQGVKGMNDLRSHYVGNKFHIEIHIEVDKNISTETSHRIGNEVKYAIQEIDDIQQAFVHIDPV